MARRLDEGRTVAAVAAGLGVDPEAVRNRRGRCAASGGAGSADRSSRPRRGPARRDEQAEDAIEVLRRQRLSGPAIARRLGRPVSAVGAVLRRRGLGRLAVLDPRPAVIRYERERPGELLHLDTRSLGRIDGAGRRATGNRARRVGREHLRVAVIDRPRLAHAELLAGEGRDDAAAFPGRALARLAALGTAVERVTTDDGSVYHSRRFRAACERHGVRHKRIRPCTPGADGEAGRPIQSGIRERAHASPFASSALGGRSPVSRLTGDDLLGSDT